MSVAETLPLQASGNSHQSLAVDDYEEQQENHDTGAAERPLGGFEKSLFALVSGYEIILPPLSLIINAGW
jgi:hypothetical protein